ncbi:MAG: glycosyltransferase family 4 protein [Gammaproteobacteria bacterium]
MANMNSVNIIYLSTFPPRACGLASFTHDLANSIDSHLAAPSFSAKIIAMCGDKKLSYDNRVLFQINQHQQNSYIKAAEMLNAMPNAKLINIQHEFGIFGGEYGCYLIPFLRALKNPVVVTLHTVLPQPAKKLREVTCEICNYTKTIVVMSERAKNLLQQEYDIAESKIRIIPHGIHQRPYTTSAAAKKAFGLENKIVLSTFGMLSRGKGIEYVLQALVHVVKKFPNVLYQIIGATHPNVLKEEGESYREFLQDTVNKLNLAKYVKFYNQHFDLDALLDHLETSDIYLAASLNPHQVTSGTLSYALGTGRPVISMRFYHAEEVVTPEVGYIIDHTDSRAYADAISKLLQNETLRKTMGKNAFIKTRNMIWPNVALQYLDCFTQYIPIPNLQRKRPAVTLKHLKKLTDDFGIFQFAQFSIPDPASGYTLDDNARALIAVALAYKHYNKLKCTSKQELLRLMHIYLDFIEYVEQNPGDLHNYVYHNKTLNTQANAEENLEDANGRAIYALAYVAAAQELPQKIKKKARKLLEKHLTHMPNKLHSPRAIAFCAKAIAKLENDHAMHATLEQYGNHLLHLYNQYHADDWRWFEPYLTYCNAILPDALLNIYKAMPHKKNYFSIAEKTLNFLIKHSFDKHYMPIGQNGWFYKNGKRAFFDQQPEDTSSMVEALHTMYSITKNEYYKTLMHKAFNWFLGDNQIQQMVYNPTTGGCCDGVRSNSINLNQGAESTIAYLYAHLLLLEIK